MTNRVRQRVTADSNPARGNLLNSTFAKINCLAFDNAMLTEYVGQGLRIGHVSWVRALLTPAELAAVRYRLATAGFGSQQATCASKGLVIGTAGWSKKECSVMPSRRMTARDGSFRTEVIDQMSGRFRPLKATSTTAFAASVA